MLVPRLTLAPADLPQESGKVFSVILTVSTILIALSLFPASSETRSILLETPTLIFALVIALVNVLAPLLLWYAWRWKTRRGGGWDVAVVRVRKDRAGKG